jgi:hypothetical protein
MAYPVVLDGRTYTLADFEGLNYVDGFPDALESFVTHAANVYTSTSTSSVEIGTGSKTFTIADTGKPYLAGTPLRIAATSDPSNQFMDGVVTSYAGSSLTIDSKNITGSGTYASWNVTIGGGTSLFNLPAITASAAEINYLDITTLGTSEASKAVTADANGVVIFDGGIVEDETAVTSTTNATTVNCRDGNVFTHVLTESTTFTFSNPPASGRAFGFTLKIVQDASASGYTVTWPASVDWPSATAPTLTATASAVDVFVFYTHDGGTNFYGFVAGQAMGTPA